MNIKLPDYVTLSSTNNAILRLKAEEVLFPLSATDQEMLRLLEAKFDEEQNATGLAAPQIGYSKRIIIFAVVASEAAKRWRPDLTDTMPKSIWINPSYEPVGMDTHCDYEACFSVENIAGLVERFKTVRYQATLPNAQKIDGVARGFLARALQHEIDHLDGRLFIDVAAPGTLLSIEEYRRLRQQAME